MSLSNEQIKDKVLDIISKQRHIDKKTIASDSTLDSLGVDSIDRVEIIIQLEEQFNVDINEQEAEKLNTVNDIVNYVSSLKK